MKAYYLWIEDLYVSSVTHIGCQRNVTQTFSLGGIRLSESYSQYNSNYRDNQYNN